MGNLLFLLLAVVVAAIGIAVLWLRGRSPRSVHSAVEAARLVDALVLDSSSRQAPLRWESQAGSTHDWDISRQIVETVDCPVLLAGGLDADNVEFAVRTVRPYGVDVCTGVRTGDALDRRKLVSFVEAIRRISA